MISMVQAGAEQHYIATRPDLMKNHAFFLFLSPSLTFPDHLVEANASAASQRSRETPRDRRSKDVARATKTHVQVSISRHFTSHNRLVVNDQHIARAKPSADSPRWRVASVLSYSSGPSDRKEEGTLLPSERLEGRGLGSYLPFTT
jgi:hypothetical protein